jgi:uncharacterized iron-regulated membrane protein
MSETPQTPSVKPVEEELAFWDRHRLSLLLVLAVVVALTLTTVSVIIYNKSGAAQLDLSRPGYSSVSDQVETTDEIDTYSASGAVNKETIEAFMKLYDAQASKAKAVDAFNGDPLNPEVLEFGSPASE